MNQPAIEYKMPEQELKQVKAKLFETIYLTLTKYETHSNNAGPFAMKLTNSVIQDMQVFIENLQPEGPLE